MSDDSDQLSSWNRGKHSYRLLWGFCHIFLSFLINMVTMTKNPHHLEKMWDYFWRSFWKSTQWVLFIFGWIIPLNSVLNYYHLMIGIQIRCKWRSESDLLQVKGPVPDGWLTLHAFFMFPGCHTQLMGCKPTHIILLQVTQVRFYEKISS